MPKHSHNFKDLTGQVFGRLAVIGEAPSRGNYKTRWTCKCECGVIAEVGANELQTGTTKSCGCYRRQQPSLSPHNYRHGHSRKGGETKTYKSWCSMLNRCQNENDTRHWKDYGGRGIAVCERWRAFQNFYADMGDRPLGMSIDRIDNNGDYGPENCRWATHKQQNRNSRGNRLITFDGLTKCVTEWNEFLRFPWGLISNRLCCGWTIERAFTTPARKTK